MKNLNFINACAFAIIVTTTSAQESNEQAVNRLAELGEGVHEVKIEGGKLKSLMVVGQDRISTVLGEARGIQTAQKRATLKANAAFVDWMKLNVVSISSAGEETIVTLTSDGQNLSEQGKASETTRQEIVTMSEGLVRGLSLVAKDQDPETQMMTLIFSWSPEKAAHAADAKRANNNPTPVLPSTSVPDSKGIPRKTVISPEFNR
jgi:hypothetical protein